MTKKPPISTVFGFWCDQCPLMATEILYFLKKEPRYKKWCHLDIWSASRGFACAKSTMDSTYDIILNREPVFHVGTDKF